MTESPQLAALLGRAVERNPAAQANEAIARMRQREGTDERPGMSYEVVLPAANPLQYFTETVLPRLVYFLDCSGAKLPTCAGVFLSVFWKDELYFIRAADALEQFSRWTGLTPAQMTERYGAQSGQ